MHQINARAKEKHWSKKKAQQKENQRERETEEKPTYIKREKKSKLLSFSFIYCISQNVLVQFVSE
jgi:hypothetical protein